MKRYYVCPIIGTGNIDIIPPDPYRMAIQDYNDLQYEFGEIPTDNDPASPNYGKPCYTWGLVLVASRNHARILADTRIKPLPQVDLDMKVSAIHTPTKSKMISDLQSLGIDTAFITGTDGFREVIRTLGKRINPAFDENNFDINEN